MGEMFRTLILCFLVSLAVSSRNLSQSPAESAPLPTVEAAPSANGNTQMGVFVLPNGSKFQTKLYDLKIIGQLRTMHKLPYYVLSGIGCEECDANVSIYIHSPSDGPMKGEGTQQRFDYPGRQFIREDHRIGSKTRMFIGNCSAGYPDAVIWFESKIGDDERWHGSVLLAQVKHDRLVVEVPKTNVPSLGEAEYAVRESRCREVPGIDQWEEP